VRKSYDDDVGPLAETFLFLADRARHTEEIRTWLKDGTIVISDRYADSTYAYQGARLEGVVKDPIRWLQRVSSPAIQEPDLTILLEVPPREGRLPHPSREELRPARPVPTIRARRRIPPGRRGRPGRARRHGAAPGPPRPLTIVPCTTNARANNVAIAVSPFSSSIRNARPKAIFVCTVGGGAAMERSSIPRGSLEPARQKLIIGKMSERERTRLAGSRAAGQTFYADVPILAAIGMHSW